MKKWFQKHHKLKLEYKCGEIFLLTTNCQIFPKNKEHATWGMGHSSRSKGVSYICAKIHRKRKNKKRLLHII